MAPGSYPSRRKVPGSSDVHGTRAVTEDGRTLRQVTACGRHNTGAALPGDRVVTCLDCIKEMGRPALPAAFRPDEH